MAWAIAPCAPRWTCSEYAGCFRGPSITEFARAIATLETGLSRNERPLSFRSHRGFRMALADLISADQIIPEMKATERWDAIVELMDLLVARGKIKPADRDGILISLKQREETMSTGIGFGIAIPHCSADCLENVIAAFGRSSKGIEFDALDNAPVKFVVLFIVPKNQFQTHLRTLAAIAKFLNDRSVRDQLGNAKTADEILAIFRARGQS